MKYKSNYQKWILFFILIINFKTMNAQNNHALSATQQGMVAISALTATGDLENLKTHLSTGLDAGLTINEIKEALVQLYAYCGFPRSLNTINTFRTVLDERKAKGISDKEGKPIIVENNVADKYEQGRKVLEELTQTPQAKPAPGFGEFAPRADAFLKEHLFADIFASDVLSFQQRELVTIAALSAMTGVEPQLQAHLGMGMNTGITAEQLTAVFDIIEKHISKEQAEIARKVFKK
ncbi:MAG: carboxymuconolactone decarboxylase family protein [Thermoflavifilum aggregans]|nr:carboxymuconolactone decarboxylase family protein [Thermoflavifilum aggregans]